MLIEQEKKKKVPVADVGGIVRALNWLLSEKGNFLESCISQGSPEKWANRR